MKQARIQQFSEVPIILGGALTSMEILSLTLLSIQTARQLLRHTSRISILPILPILTEEVSALQAM